MFAGRKHTLETRKKIRFATKAEWKKPNSKLKLSHVSKRDSSVWKIAGVYAILNLKSGIVYVGCSGDVIGRWAHHLRLLRRKIHCKPFLEAFGNTKPKDRVFVLLERVEGLQKDRANRESYWKSIFPQHCNYDHFSTDHKNAISRSTVSAWKSPQRRKKLGDEMRVRWSDPLYRKQISEKVRATMLSKH